MKPKHITDMITVKIPTADLRNITAYPTFGDENASAGWTFSKENGRWVARSQVLELADDEYSVTELDVSRFKMTGSSVYSSGNYRRFTFENEKDNWQYFSHKSVVINRLIGGAAGE